MLFSVRFNASKADCLFIGCRQACVLLTSSNMRQLSGRLKRENGSNRYIFNVMCSLITGWDAWQIVVANWAEGWGDFNPYGVIYHWAVKEDCYMSVLLLLFRMTTCLTYYIKFILEIVDVGEYKTKE